MSVAAEVPSASLQMLEKELLPFADATSDSSVKSSQAAASPKRIRRRSKALSISSLSDESLRDKSSLTTKAVATEACRDVERELAAIETRLSVFQRRTRRQGSETYHSAVVPFQSKVEGDDEVKENGSVSPTPSVSSNAVAATSPTFLKLSEAQREAGAVADQVATTLLKCDQLLQRVKSCDASRVSSVSSTSERSFRELNKTRKMVSSRHSEVSNSSFPSPAWEAKSNLAIEDEEAILTQKAAAVKRFAARCQRDIESSTTKIEVHHEQMQTAFLKELQRKYDSKKHMTLMALRERYEKETKAIVRTKMEEYEFEEATALKKTQAQLLEERNRALDELHSSHNAAMDESLSQLELQLSSETESAKRELGNQMQEELTMRLKQMQEESRESFRRWEIEQREKVELELYNHREAAIASVLKAQEERTAGLKQEIQASHFEKEEAELEKLKRALAFGAQAQLQQLRKRLEMEHEEKIGDVKTEATLALEKETEEMKQMLTRSHREQEEQLRRDLDKKNRVSIMELHDSMQASHHKSLQALKDAAEQRKADALEKHRQNFEQECRQELQILEQTLDQEMSAKLRQLEMDHAEECELKLEQLRMRAVNQHSRELEAKRSRMIQCKNVLLAEAAAFLSFDNDFESSVDNQGTRREIKPEEDSAAAHLLELKKHLSKELAQYVDVMVAEFDELSEEQSILVAKITESTQLYLSFKRQCGVLDAQSTELASALETLHDQLEKKDEVCKKLYQANEALLKRLETPTLHASSKRDLPLSLASSTTSTRD